DRAERRSARSHDGPNRRARRQSADDDLEAHAGHPGGRLSERPAGGGDASAERADLLHGNGLADRLEYHRPEWWSAHPHDGPDGGPRRQSADDDLKTHAGYPRGRLSERPADAHDVGDPGDHGAGGRGPSGAREAAGWIARVRSVPAGDL